MTETRRQDEAEIGIPKRGVRTPSRCLDSRSSRRSAGAGFRPTLSRGRRESLRPLLGVGATGQRSRSSDWLSGTGERRARLAPLQGW